MVVFFIIALLPYMTPIFLSMLLKGTQFHIPFEPATVGIFQVMDLKRHFCKIIGKSRWLFSLDFRAGWRVGGLNSLNLTS